MKSVLNHRFLPFVSSLILVAGIVLTVVSLPTDSSTDTIDHSQDTPLVGLERADNVPDLPFDDNPDPDQCGIPTVWGSQDPAWVTGVYDGEMIQPTVFLYDSHQRFSIIGEVPHGSEVAVVMFQENPTLDFYFVKTSDGQEGWLPAPFLSFEPVQASAEPDHIAGE